MKFLWSGLAFNLLLVFNLYASEGKNSPSVIEVHQDEDCRGLLVGTANVSTYGLTVDGLFAEIRAQSPRVEMTAELHAQLEQYIRRLRRYAGLVSKLFSNLYGIEQKASIRVKEGVLETWFQPMDKGFRVNLVGSKTREQRDPYTGDYMKVGTPTPFRSSLEVSYFLQLDGNAPEFLRRWIVKSKKTARAFGLQKDDVEVSADAQILLIPEMPGYIRVIERPDQTYTLHRAIPSDLTSSADPAGDVVRDSMRSLNDGLPRFLKASYLDREKMLALDMSTRRNQNFNRSNYFVGFTHDHRQKEGFGKTRVTVEIPVETMIQMSGDEHYAWEFEFEELLPFYLHREWIVFVESEGRLLYSRDASKYPVLQAKDVRVGMTVKSIDKFGNIQSGLVTKVDESGWSIKVSHRVNKNITAQHLLPNGIFLLEPVAPK